MYYIFQYLASPERCPVVSRTNCSVKRQNATEHYNIIAVTMTHHTIVLRPLKWHICVRLKWRICGAQGPRPPWLFEVTQPQNGRDRVAMNMFVYSWNLVFWFAKIVIHIVDEAQGVCKDPSRWGFYPWVKSVSLCLYVIQIWVTFNLFSTLYAPNVFRNCRALPSTA